MDASMTASRRRVSRGVHLRLLGPSYRLLLTTMSTSDAIFLAIAWTHARVRHSMLVTTQWGREATTLLPPVFSVRIVGWLDVRLCAYQQPRPARCKRSPRHASQTVPRMQHGIVQKRILSYQNSAQQARVVCTRRYSTQH